MSKYDGKYGIILNKWIKVYPDQWPISEYEDTLAQARAITQTGGDPELLSKKVFNATFIESKSLINADTGRVVSGGIYKINEK